MGLRVFFFSPSARFFVAAEEDLSASARRAQTNALMHTYVRQTCDGMCVPTAGLHTYDFE